MTSEEVAFTLSETRAFLQQIKNLSLAPNLVGQIHRLTEGWAGGLVLLADLLERLPEMAQGDYLPDDLTNRFQGEIFHYFGEQIFSSLADQSQEFLIKSSIYDIISPDLLEKFDGLPNANELLEDLARRNLFVQTLYDQQKGWLYRYHQLFKDFLQIKFKKLLGKGQQEALFLRAGVLSEQAGEPEQAVKFYLKAQAYRQAVAIIERIGIGLVTRDRTDDLLQWLKAIPKNFVAANPWLLSYYYMVRRLTGSAELILDLKQALTLFQQQGDVRGSFLAMAYLLEALILRGHPAIPNVHELLAQGEALVQAGGAGRYPAERAILWFQIGFAHYIRSGNPRKGLWACQNAYLLARDLGDLPLQISALTYVHGVLSVVGEFARAAEIVQQVDKLLEKHSYPDLESLQLIHVSQLHWFQGDAKKGALAVKQAREKIEEHGLSFLLPPAMLYDHLIKTMNGDYREAEEIGRSLAHLTLAIGNMWLHGVSLLWLAANLYQQGDYLKAREALERASM
jgi:LuxR family maltose regulon positive regulatory protein